MSDYNRINGRLGQVCGPFNAGEDLLAKGGAIDKFTKESDLRQRERNLNNWLMELGW